MFYDLTFDTERIDQSIENGNPTIFADSSNLKEIEHSRTKKGYFRYIINEGKEINEWYEPNFFYSSKASDLESEYLRNINRWPLVHINVIEAFGSADIKGIQYLPVNLIDVVTGKNNYNYFVMNILNHIDAYDLNKCDYKYMKDINYYSFAPKGIYLDYDACEGYDIFRCSISTIPIYVSQKVKDIVEKNNWVGFAFDEMK